MKKYCFSVIDKVGKRRKMTADFLTFKDFKLYLQKNHFSLIKYKVEDINYRVSSTRILLFTQGLKNLLESGLTISESLEILLAQEENKKMAGIINNIFKQIITGSNIYSAFSNYSTIFGDTYLNLLLVGEESGNLTENLEKICHHINSKEKLKKKIKEALLYPIIVFLFVLMLLIFMFIFVFPNFILLFEETNVQLPLLTRAIVFISKHTSHFIFLILLLLIFLSIFFKSTTSNFKNFSIKLPILKKILRKTSLIFFCENFAIMNEAGINLLTIFKILKSGNNYIFFNDELKKVESKLKLGYSLFESFASTKLFNEAQLKLINIGERSGNLSVIFNSIASSLREELDYYFFKLTTILQPLLLLILGVIVGVVLLSIYLPIFNISETIL